MDPNTIEQALLSSATALGHKNHEFEGIPLHGSIAFKTIGCFTSQRALKMAHEVISNAKLTVDDHFVTRVPRRETGGRVTLHHLLVSGLHVIVCSLRWGGYGILKADTDTSFTQQKERAAFDEIQANIVIHRKNTARQLLIANGYTEQELSNLLK